MAGGRETRGNHAKALTVKEELVPFRARYYIARGGGAVSGFKIEWSGDETGGGGQGKLCGPGLVSVIRDAIWRKQRLVWVKVGLAAGVMEDAMPLRPESTVGVALVAVAGVLEEEVHREDIGVAGDVVKFRFGLY